MVFTCLFGNPSPKITTTNPTAKTTYINRYDLKLFAVRYRPVSTGSPSANFPTGGSSQ